MNTIEAAIQQAQQAAGNFSREVAGAAGQATGTAVANAPVGGTAVGMPMSKGAPLGFDDLAAGSLNVVGWLKVNEYGIKIGTDKTLFEKLEVAIPLNEVAYCYQVRFGNPAQYKKTYDRVTESRTGASWIETVQQAQRVDPRAYEYRSADIPFYALEDIVAKDGKVLVHRGEAVGHTLATTGWKGFAAFMKKLQGQGVDVSNSTVKLTLGYEAQKNDSGEWGILTFSNPEVIAAMPWELN